MDKYKLYEKAIEKWGEGAQLMMLQEECAELIVAVAHVFRKRKELETGLIDELADVQIMVEQITFMTGNQMEVEKKISEKLKRLEERLSTKEVV